MKFIVTNQKIEVPEEFKPVSNSVGIYEIEFEFSEEWDDYMKVASFKKDDVVYETMLDSDNKCVVPAESLNSYGNLKIGVYGLLDDKVYPTVWSDNIYIQGGATNGNNPNIPPQSIYDQLLENMYTKDEVDEKLSEGFDEISKIKNDYTYAAKENCTSSRWIYVSAKEEIRNDSIYIEGNDISGTGTVGNPFRSLTRAFQESNRFGGSNDVRIRMLTHGIYDMDFGYVSESGVHNCTFNGMTIHIAPLTPSDSEINDVQDEYVPDEESFVINFKISEDYPDNTAAGIKFYVSHVNLQNLRVNYYANMEFDSGFAYCENVWFHSLDETTTGKGITVNGGGFASFKNTSAVSYEASNARASFTGKTIVRNPRNADGPSPVFNFVNSDIQFDTDVEIEREAATDADAYFIQSTRTTLYVGSNFHIDIINQAKRDLYSRAFRGLGGIVIYSTGSWPKFAMKSNGDKHYSFSTNLPTLKVGDSVIEILS